MILKEEKNLSTTCYSIDGLLYGYDLSRDKTLHTCRSMPYELTCAPEFIEFYFGKNDLGFGYDKYIEIIRFNNLTAISIIKF